MKTLMALISVTVLGSASVMSQGMIFFADQGSGQRIMVSANADGSGVTPIGNVAASAAIGAGPGQVRFQLYLQTNGVPVTFNADGTPQNMFLVGTATNSASTLSLAAGLFNGGVPYVLVSPWVGNMQVEFYYWATTLNGSYSGHSTLGTGYELAPFTTPPNLTFGTARSQVLGFTLTPVYGASPVPEPATIVLGVFGSAALWSFRRRRC
jgi:hypothetical protein